MLFIGDWVGSKSTSLESTERKSSKRVGPTIAERDKKQTWVGVKCRPQDRCRRCRNAEAPDQVSCIGGCVWAHLYPLQSIKPLSVSPSQLLDLSSVWRHYLDADREMTIFLFSNWQFCAISSRFLENCVTLVFWLRERCLAVICRSRELLCSVDFWYFDLHIAAERFATI